MKDCVHYVLTRWNMFQPDMSVYNNPKVKDPEDWMAHREKLFDKIALPMMEAQTCTDFIWLLAFDPKTPQALMDKYAGNEKLNIQIIHEHPKTWLQDHYRAIAAKWMITSRIDNDDFYVPTAIEALQNIFARIIEINTGVGSLVDINFVFWDIIDDVFYDNRRPSPNSPFISVVENLTIGKPKTVFHADHTYMPKYFPSQKFMAYMAVATVNGYNAVVKQIGAPLNNELVADFRKELYRLGVTCQL